MSIFDTFPDMNEIHEQYGDSQGGGQEPREDYTLLAAEYQERYGAQFSYEFRRQSILPCPPPREIDATMPLSYNVDEYHFSEELRLGVHKKIGFVVVFHPDVRKNYIIPPEMFEAYAQAVLRRLRMMRDIMRLLRVKEELYLKITPCEIGEAGFENTRGTISPQCLPLPAMPLHFGWGCD